MCIKHYFTSRDIGVLTEKDTLQMILVGGMPSTTTHNPRMIQL